MLLVEIKWGYVNKLILMKSDDSEDDREMIWKWLVLFLNC